MWVRLKASSRLKALFCQRWIIWIFLWRMPWLMSGVSSNRLTLHIVDPKTWRAEPVCRLQLCRRWGDVQCCQEVLCRGRVASGLLCSSETSVGSARMFPGRRQLILNRESYSIFMWVEALEPVEPSMNMVTLMKFLEVLEDILMVWVEDEGHLRDA